MTESKPVTKFHEGYFLLTGVTGFLGSEVFCRLARAVGYDRVYCMVRKRPRVDSIFGRRLREQGLDGDFEKIKFIETDFGNTETFAKALKEAEAVLPPGKKFSIVHMAAIIHANGADEKRQQHRLNIEVTDELLDWAANRGAHFIYMSSVVSFGATLGKTAPRDEDDFVNFPWVSKFFSYYTSKRESHIRVESRAKIPVSLLCPGIIHGSLELEKSSRKHLQYLREGKLKLAPSGGANFVGLDRVAQAVVQAALTVPQVKVQTQLLVDENMCFVDYFNKYVRLARGNDAHVVRKLPALLGLVAITLHILLSTLGLHISILETLSQGSMYLSFKSKHKQPPTEGLEANLKKSLIGT